MNRVIKFRAWGRYGDWDSDYSNRKFVMIDGDNLAFEDYEPLTNLLQDKEDEAYFMQFTGLLDKNGKEIYENDILKESDGTIYKANWKGCLYGTSRMGQQLACDNPQTISRDFEIIGNIFETPNLLPQ